VQLLPLRTKRARADRTLLGCVLVRGFERVALRFHRCLQLRYLVSRRGERFLHRRVPLGDCGLELHPKCANLFPGLMTIGFALGNHVLALGQVSRFTFLELDTQHIDQLAQLTRVGAREPEVIIGPG
jgi:hypothetical protein